MNEFALEIAKNAMKTTFELSFKTVTSLPFFGFLSVIFSDASFKQKQENGLSMSQYLILTFILFFIETTIFGSIFMKRILIDGFGMSSISFLFSMIFIGAFLGLLSNQIVKLAIPHYLSLKIYLNSL